MNKILTIPGLLLMTPITAVHAAAPLDGIGGGKVLETLAGLALVLLLIFALARVLQKVNGSTRDRSQSMRIVSRISLGAREKIVLLHVADRHILVGITPQAISSLHVFEEKVPTVQSSEPLQQPGYNFKAVLQNLGGGPSK